jgi:hypothetical protein
MAVYLEECIYGLELGAGDLKMSLLLYCCDVGKLALEHPVGHSSERIYLHIYMELQVGEKSTHFWTSKSRSVRVLLIALQSRH